MGEFLQNYWFWILIIIFFIWMYGSGMGCSGHVKGHDHGNVNKNAAQNPNRD